MLQPIDAPEKDAYTFSDGENDDPLLSSSSDKKRRNQKGETRRVDRTSKDDDDIPAQSRKKRRKSDKFDAAEYGEQSQVSDLAEEEAKPVMDAKESRARAGFSVPTGFTFLPMASACDDSTGESLADESVDSA